MAFPNGADVQSVLQIFTDAHRKPTEPPPPSVPSVEATRLQRLLTADTASLHFDIPPTFVIQFRSASNRLGQLVEPHKLRQICEFVVG